MKLNNEAHNNIKHAIASKIVSKNVDDHKIKLYFHFELTVLNIFLFLTLRYLDDNTRVDRTVWKQ